MKENAVRDRFIEVLEKKHITGYAISKAIGVTEGAISNFRRGKTKELKFITLSNFCEHFGVNINYLMNGKEPMMKVISKNGVSEKECADCKALQRQIHHLTSLLDTYESKIEGYKIECEKLRKKNEDMLKLYTTDGEMFILVISFRKKKSHRTRWLRLCDIARECNGMVEDDRIVAMIPDLYVCRAYDDLYPLFSSVGEIGVITATFNGEPLTDPIGWMFQKWLGELGMKKVKPDKLFTERFKFYVN